MNLMKINFKYIFMKIFLNINISSKMNNNKKVNTNIMISTKIYIKCFFILEFITCRLAVNSVVNYFSQTIIARLSFFKFNINTGLSVSFYESK